MIITSFNNTDIVTGLDQHDYGQTLRIQDSNLPRVVEIHFSLSDKNDGTNAIRRIGYTKNNATDVTIPDDVLKNIGFTGNYYYIYVYVYVASETEGKTTKKITLQVNGRPEPEADPGHEEPGLFQRTIDAVNDSADRAETAEAGSVTAKDEAQEISDNIAENVSGMVQEAQSAKNTAIENANIAVNNAEGTEADRQEVVANKATIETLKAETEAIKQDALHAEQRVIQLMSTDTKSYFFATLADRDAKEGIRNCDRCSVYETRADYIYDTENVDGDDVNPEWIKTSDWDALKTVAWDIITGKPNFATIATSGSYKDLKDVPNRYNTPLVLDGTADTVTWDYSAGDTAIVTLTASKPLQIDNFYNGCVAVIHAYGAALDFSDNTKYNRCITFGYLEAQENEHMTYTLFRNGAKWDITALPVGGASYE